MGIGNSAEETRKTKSRKKMSGIGRKICLPRPHRDFQNSGDFGRKTRQIDRRTGGLAKKTEVTAVISRPTVPQ